MPDDLSTSAPADSVGRASAPADSVGRTLVRDSVMELAWGNFIAPIDANTLRWIEEERPIFRGIMNDAIVNHGLADVVTMLESEIRDGNAYRTQVMVIDTLRFLANADDAMTGPEAQDRLRTIINVRPIAFQAILDIE